MNAWQLWLKAPQTLWLRRAVFQVHLWMGIACGLYVLVISVSGSAFVLSPLFHAWFVNSEVASIEGAPLSGAALDESIRQAYGGYEVMDAMPSSLPDRAVYITLRKDGRESNRFFDQYAGVDLGSTLPWQVAAAEWLVDLHDDLFLGPGGRRINGIGGAFFLLMLASGLFLWWQGKARWREALVIRPSGRRSLLWQLHACAGFWSLILIFAWGVSGLYFAFPDPFRAFAGLPGAQTDGFGRTRFLQFLIDLHFGRFEETWLRLLWGLLGLLPALMFLTGFLLWWRRVVRRRPTARD